MRPDDWDIRLSDAIECARSKAFSWGDHDCVTWAMTVRGEISGRPAPDWAGRYKTAIGAARVLRKLGHENLRGAADEVLGEALISPNLARRGDLVMMETPSLPLKVAFGVCLGRDSAFVAEDGLTLYPTRDCAAAWRV